MDFKLAVTLLLSVICGVAFSTKLGRGYSGVLSIECKDFTLKFRLETARIPYRCIDADDHIFSGAFSRRNYEEKEDTPCSSPDGCPQLAPRVALRANCQPPVTNKCPEKDCCYNTSAGLCHHLCP